MEVIIDGIPLRDIDDDEIKRRKMKEERGKGGKGEGGRRTSHCIYRAYPHSPT